MAAKVVSGGQLSPSRLSDAAIRVPYIRAAVLGGFAELVSQAGGDPAALVTRVGIPVRALCDPDMVISWTALGELTELAAEELQKSSLGLEWLLAAPEPLLNFGAIALIARFTDTVGDWCFHSRNYWHWHTNASRADLLEAEGGEVLTLRVGFSTLVPPSRHQSEYILGGVCAMLRMLTPSADHGIDLIRFRHARPRDVSLHEAMFPCPIEFGSDHDELVYRRQLHEQRIELGAETLDAWLTHYVAARTGTIADYDDSIRAKVEIAIPSLIGTAFCTQPNIARLFGVSAKSLQRQLARDGTNFAGLLDKTRERIARQLLAESDIPVASIAGLLGYANTPPFTAAMRRWTSLSPRLFRNAAKAEWAEAKGREAGAALDLS